MFEVLPLLVIAYILFDLARVIYTTHYHLTVFSYAVGLILVLAYLPKTTASDCFKIKKFSWIFVFIPMIFFLFLGTSKINVALGIFASISYLLVMWGLDCE